MFKMSHKIVALVLTALLGLGAVAEAAYNVGTFLPQSCCCTTPMETPPAHHSPITEMRHDCSPQKPAPCCRIESNQPKTHQAVTSKPDIEPYRLSASPAIDASVLDTGQNPALCNSLMKDGPPKIPLVPIYLQTLSILC